MTEIRDWTLMKNQSQDLDYIKEEKQEHLIGQEGMPPSGLLDGFTRFTNTSVSVMNEEKRKNLSGPDPNLKTLPILMKKHHSTLTMKNEDDDDYDCWQKPLSDSETESSDNICKRKKTPKSGLNGRVECSLCGKSLHKRYISTHMKFHTDEKRFGCDVCGKRFCLATTLTVHMRVHTGEKPYDCSVCGKMFKQHSHLKEHMRIHTGEKPFVCHVCGRKLNSSSGFRTHLRTHTGEKPFSCDICGERFPHSTTLTGHKRTHTGEKPYQCDVCGKRFRLKQHLRLHVKTHTGKQ